MSRLVGVTWSVATPTTAGAVAVVEIAGDAAAVDGALSGLGVGAVDVGRVRLVRVIGVDEMLIARWSARLVHLMPHGGAAVVRALVADLAGLGVEEHAALPAVARFPEARSDIEAEMLATLARAASPRAVDLLLDQPRRWAGRSVEGAATARDACLMRLVDPPLVVAVGPANVGKSTLLNALAGRSVSIVADEAGTTRDHVGVMLELDGVAVRFVDTPGVRESADEIEIEARREALGVARQADLVLLCGDAGEGPPSVELLGSRADAAVLRVALRADRGVAEWPSDVVVSVREGRGLVELAAAVRRALVSDGDLESGEPWRFWGVGPLGARRVLHL